MGVGASHDERAERPHLAMQNADRVGRGVVGPERVGADQFGQMAGAVRGGLANRTHFMQHDRDAGLRRLPRRLRTGEAAADDVNGTHAAACHKAGAGVKTLEKKAAPEGAALP